MGDTEREILEAAVGRTLPHLPEETVRDLAGVLDRLIGALRPERIYVFGSQARGQAMPDSDVDLLLVVPGSDLPAHQREQMAYHAAGRHSVPLDLMVLTHAEFERRRTVVSSLPATVVREGRMLYAA
ncbi:MAG: nucleotidyltransferase domain-containing protein [Chloroflexota bacterium]